MAKFADITQTPPRCKERLEGIATEEHLSACEYENSSENDER